jgi:glucose-6-phosphate 1-dehydrogenase
MLHFSGVNGRENLFELGYLPPCHNRSTIVTLARPPPRLAVESWRWQGVPFYIRGGKSLRVTCTEIVARLRRPPTLYQVRPAPNYLRFRISPVVEVAMGMNVMDREEKGNGETVELLASRHPGERDAYERVLTDAMLGDRTLFAREDYIEEAWRIVDPVVSAGHDLHSADRGRDLA